MKTPENLERAERLKRKTALLLKDPVFDDIKKIDEALEAAEVADAARVLLLEPELDGVLSKFERGDEDAGKRLLEEWAASEPGCLRLKEKAGVDVCANVIRSEGSPASARKLAVKILANMVEKGLGPDVARTKKALVSIGGAFCMDADPETVLEATWILCFMARRHCWGGFFDMDVFQERLGDVLFDYTCSLDPEEPERKRDFIEEALTSKLFELLYRMKQHKFTDKAFEKLYDQEVPRRSVLTAAIEYVLDPRAVVSRSEARHRFDPCVDSSTPSGLDCALRSLHAMAELDVERLGALVDDEEQKDVVVYRLHRVADAVRTCRTVGGLEANEVISVTLAMVQAMWPFHDFDKMLEKMEQQEKPFTGYHREDSEEDDDDDDERQQQQRDDGDAAEKKTQPPPSTEEDQQQQHGADDDAPHLDVNRDPGSAAYDLEHIPDYDDDDVPAAAQQPSLMAPRSASPSVPKASSSSSSRKSTTTAKKPPAASPVVSQPPEPPPPPGHSPPYATSNDGSSSRPATPMDLEP